MTFISLDTSFSTANSSYTSTELAQQIETSSAVLILASSDLLDVAKGAVKEAGLSEKQIYVLPGVDGKVVAKGLKSYEELKADASGFKPVTFTEEQQKKDIAYLPFSSGTSALNSCPNMTCTDPASLRFRSSQAQLDEPKESKSLRST